MQNATHARRSSAARLDLGNLLRGAAGVAGLIMLGWLAISAPGCAGHGKYTTEHKSGAKVKLEAIKAATEHQMAQEAFLAGDLQKAMRHVDASLSLNATVARSHLLRGRIFMELGNLEAAGRSLDMAGQIDDKSPDAYYYRGILAERLCRSEDATGFYLKAAELDAQNAQYAVAAAETLIARGRLDEAESYLRGRTDLYTHNAGLRQTLGHIEMMKGNPPGAVEMFNQARLLAPNDDAILEDLVRAQVATGRWGEAEYNLSRLLKNDKNAARRDLKHMQAQCLVQLDRTLEARQVLLALTQDQSGASDAQAWIGLGEASLLLNDLPRVRQCASRIVAISPERPEGYVLRALVLQRSGDLRGAKAALERALQSERTAETLVLLGMLQEDLNDTEGARLSYGQALRADPANTAAASMLAGLESRLANVSE